VILGGKISPPCQIRVCYCSPLPRRLHDTKNQKNTKGRDPSLKNGRETVFQAGDETMGGKRNFTTYGDVIGRICAEIGIRRTRVARDVLPPKRGRASLVRTPLWLQATGAMIACIRPEPVDAKIECAIVHHCVASLQHECKSKRCAGGERERESLCGTEIVTVGDAAVCDFA
jgi:hypothetical protein